MKYDNSDTLTAFFLSIVISAALVIGAQFTGVNCEGRDAIKACAAYYEHKADQNHGTFKYKTCKE